MLSDSNARLAAARRLTNRRARRESGLFLAEGAQAVREAVRSGRAVEVFGVEEAISRHADLLGAVDVPVAHVSDKAAASLSETVTPQGLVAVCRMSEPDGAVGGDLAVILVEANDPGNAGTILRTADAAGAGAVIFAGDSVDPYNGKCVRASAGSLFHLRVLTGVEPLPAIGQCQQAGMQTLATSGHGRQTLDELAEQGRLEAKTAWIFGNEARGLPDEIIAAAQESVRIPIYGQAESLNLAAAAALCLYASAHAQHSHDRAT